MPTLTTLTSLGGAIGEDTGSGVAIDATGDLFGVTSRGGANSGGVAFEIAATGAGYASTPTALAALPNYPPGDANGGLIADAAGNLFFTTTGSTFDVTETTVDEIAKTSTGYANTPAVLDSLEAPLGGAAVSTGLTTDGSGDIVYGVSVSGPGQALGYISEIAKSGASANLTGNFADGSISGRVVVDPAGNLFFPVSQATVISPDPMTFYGPGGAPGATLYELAKAGAGYASAAAPLVQFSGDSITDVTEDASGNLFGVSVTSPPGEASGDGTVFELFKTGAGYADAATTLASFDESIGVDPSGLIADAAGNLFGTTSSGGPGGDGTVFEIAKTSTGYASAPTILASFDGANGDGPQGLVADRSGDLFGTTLEGGADDDGTVFELTGVGFRSLAITSAGGATSQAAQTISGTIDTADAGLTVSIYDGSSLLATATPKTNGDWSASVNLLATPTPQSITAQATNADGVVETSMAVVYTLENVPATYEIEFTQGSLNTFLGGIANVLNLSVVESALDSVFPQGRASFAANTINFEVITQSGEYSIASDVAGVVVDTSGANVFSNDPNMAIVGSGDDTLHAAAGSNVLVAGSGKDYLFGGSVADTLVGGGQTKLIGGSGNESLQGGIAAGAHDTLIAGSGDDTLLVATGDNHLDGDGGFLQGDVTMWGGSGDDTLNASGSGRAVLHAGSGNQTLFGGYSLHVLTMGIGPYDPERSMDTMFAGSGNTLIKSDAGNDRLVGGTGNDTLRGGTGDDTMYGGMHSKIDAGSGYNDFMYGSTIAGSTDSMFGGSGADLEVANAGNDELNASGGGDDTLKGGSGNDTMFSGAAGHSTIWGGSGNDTINLTAGTGATVYAGSGQNSIVTGTTDNDTITGGAGTATVYTTETQSQVTNQSMGAGGYLEITFTSGHVLTVEGVQIDFHGGGVVHS